MTSMRKQQAKQTRQRLIDAGVELIEERGYDGASVDDITERAGVSKGTFYVHFKSKEDFFYQIDVKAFDEMELQVEAPGLSTEERIRCYLEAWIDQNGSYSDEFTMRWVRHVASPSRERIVGARSKIELDEQQVARIIEQGVKNGELVSDTPTVDIARLLTAVLYGTTMKRVSVAERMDLAAWKETLSSLLVGPLLAPYRKK